MKRLILLLTFGFQVLILSGQPVVETVGFILTTGEHIIGEMDNSRENLRLRYQNGEEIPFEQIGVLDTHYGMMLLKTGLMGEIPMAEILKVEKQLWRQLTFLSGDIASGSTKRSMELGHEFTDLENRNQVNIKIEVIDVPGPAYETGVFLKYSMLDISPLEFLESQAFLADFGIELSVFPRLIYPDGTKQMLPHIEFGPNLNYSYVKMPCELWDDILSEDSQFEFVMAVCRRFPFKEISSCVLGEPFYLNKTRPKFINSEVIAGAIKLDWEYGQADVNHYNIYRGVKSANGYSKGVLIGRTTGKETTFIDADIILQTRYFYKVCAVSTEQYERPPSEETMVYYESGNYFRDLSRLINVSVDEDFQVSGRVEHITGEPVAGALIQLKEVNSGALLSETITDASGRFTNQGFISLVPGIYPLLVSSVGQTGGVESNLTVIVEENPQKGHDLEIRRTGIQRKACYSNQTFPIENLIENKGKLPETGSIHYSLVLENGTLINEINRALAINGGQTISTNQSFSLAGLGGKLCYLMAETEGHPDFITTNNQDRKPVFVIQPTAKESFKLSHYNFIKTSGTWIRTINSHIIKVIQGIGSGAIVSVDGDTLNFVPEQWYFNASSNLVIYFYGYSPLNGEIVSMKVGVPSSELIMPSFDELGVRGDMMNFDLTIPTAYDFSNNIEYLFSGLNIQNWSQSFSQINGLDYSRRLSIQIPEDETAGDLETWIKVGTIDDSYWWLQKVYLRVRESFDIGISTVSLDNNVSKDDLAICGDILDYKVSIINHSGYFTPSQKIGFKVELNDTLIYADSRQTNLPPFATENITFSFPTFKQKAGNYRITITAPCSYDKEQQDNTYTAILPLSETPKLSFNLSYLNTEAFITNVEEFIYIDVLADGNSISDAKVTISILTPDAFIHHIACEYDSVSGKYIFPFRPTIGGVYSLNISASKIRHIESTESIDFPVYSYLYLTAQDSLSKVGSEYSLNLSTVSVGDLNGLACDITYDSDYFKYTGYTDLNAFEGGEKEGQVFVLDKGGSLVIGMSKLGGERGNDIYKRTGLLNLHFQAVKEGRTMFDINNFQGISSKGKDILLIGDSRFTNVKIQPNVVNSQFIMGKDTLLLYDTCKVQLRLLNLENVGSVSGVISYDTSLFEVIDISEGTLMNEFSSKNTIGIFENRGQGIIDFGISRINTKKGLFELSGNLLEIKLVSKAHGNAGIDLTDLHAYPPIPLAGFSTELTSGSITVQSSINDYVYMNTFPDTTFVVVGKRTVIDFTVDSLQNGFAFSGDLLFDNQAVTIVSLTEGELFNENKTISTAFLTDIQNDQGRVIMGLSRLGQNGDVTCHSAQRLFSVEIEGLKEDTIELKLLNSRFYLNGGRLAKPGNLSGGVVIIQGTPTIDISANMGWNIISIPLTPNDISMMSIVQPMLENGSFVKLQDEAGNAVEDVLSVGWVNNVGNWKYSEGYRLRINQNVNLRYEGASIDLPADINLLNGWNIISYPARYPQPAMKVVDQMIAHNSFVKLQDEKGRAIEVIPGTNILFNNVGSLFPGKGYLVRVLADDSITINYPRFVPPALIVKSSANLPAYLQSGSILKGSGQSNDPCFLSIWSGNGFSHMNLYLKNLAENGYLLLPGDEVAVFDETRCVGVAVVNDIISDYIPVIVSADDPATNEIDGFVDGNPISLKVCRRGRVILISSLNFTPAVNTTFEQGGSVAIEFGSEELASFISSDLVSSVIAYPNPFTDEININCHLKYEVKMKMEIFDMLGEIIYSSIQYLNPGFQKITWHGETQSGYNVAPGIFYIRLTSANGELIEVIKVVKN